MGENKACSLFILFIFAFLFVQSSPVIALQQGDYGLFPIIDFYSPTDYMAHPQNWGITEDEFGFLYFANMNGILRYNGHSWELFETPVSPVAIHHASDGTLFTALTSDLGYMKRIPNGGLEYVSLSDSIDAELPPFLDTYTIAEFNNHIFFLTDGGIIQWNGTDMHVYTDITNFFVTDYDSLFMLQRRDRSLFLPLQPETNIIVDTKEPLPLLYGLFPAGDKTYTAFGFEGTLFKVQVNDDIIRITDYANPAFDYLKDIRIYDFVRAQDSNFIITTRAHGIYQTNLDGTLQYHFNEDSGLRTNFALGVHQDRFKNIWQAGYYGISKIKTDNFSFVIDNRNGIQGEIWDALSFQDGVYISTNRGVYRAFADSQKLSPFEKISTPEEIDGVGDFSIVFNPATQENGLFFITHHELYEIEGKQLTLITDTIKNEPFTTPIHPNIIFGSDGFQSLNAVRFENGRWIDSSEETLIFDDLLIYANASDPSTFWISYYTKNLSKLIFKTPENANKYEWATGPFGVSYHIENADPKKMLPEMGHIIQSYIDDELYFITLDGIFGLTDTNELERKPFNFVENDAEWVYTDMRQDKIGHIWYLRTRSNELDFGYVEQKDDETINDIPFGNYTIPLSAELYYWSDRNMVGVITPERIHVIRLDAGKESHTPDLLTTLIQVTQDDSPLDIFDPYGETRQVVLPYSQSRLVFEVASNYITSTGKNRFSYYLEGADPGFSQPVSSNKREYVNLREGNYTLFVRTTNGFGKTSTNELITFTITPPLHRSMAAYFFYALLIVLFIYIGVQYRSKSVLNQRNVLRKMVLKRTADLEKKTNQLEQANEIKLRLLRMTAHDLRSPLSAITGYSNLISMEDDLSTAKEYAAIIEETSTKMRGIIQSMLASGARNLEHIDLLLEKVDIPELIDRLYVQLKIQLKRKSQKLELIIPPNIPEIYVDVVRITEVFDNLLNNAMKYSPPKSTITLRVRYEKENNVLIVSISDQGPGFAETDFSNLFKENQTLSAKVTGNETSTGLGLFIVKQLVQAHGGEIAIRNNDNGVGASITVMLPVSNTDKDS